MIFSRHKQDGFWDITFKVTFTSFLIILVVELFINGFFVSYFNPIWLLIVSLLSGIMATLKD